MFISYAVESETQTHQYFVRIYLLDIHSYTQFIVNTFVLFIQSHTLKIRTSLVTVLFTTASCLFHITRIMNAKILQPNCSQLDWTKLCTHILACFVVEMNENEGSECQRCYFGESNEWTRQSEREKQRERGWKKLKLLLCTL